jgi:cob(I)alamin adenosyltransferase
MRLQKTSELQYKKQFLLFQQEQAAAAAEMAHTMARSVTRCPMRLA